MAEDIRARQLMLRDFAKIRSDQSLAEALEALVAVQSQEKIPNALIVTDTSGAYEGLLTARLLARSLLSLWMPEKNVREDENRLEEELLDVVQDRLRMRVHDALIRGIPVARPEDRLLRLIEVACDKRLEFIAVVEDGAVLGIVPVTGVFQATVSLALTPDDEGIRFDQKAGN
jgi:CBS domain-containing protein